MECLWCSATFHPKLWTWTCPGPWLTCPYESSTVVFPCVHELDVLPASLLYCSFAPLCKHPDFDAVEDSYKRHICRALVLSESSHMRSILSIICRSRPDRQEHIWQFCNRNHIQFKVVFAHDHMNIWNNLPTLEMATVPATEQSSLYMRKMSLLMIQLGRLTQCVWGICSPFSSANDLSHVKTWTVFMFCTYNPA